MAIFIEFYLTMLGFINYRLFSNLNISYPPKLELPDDKYKSLRDMNDEEKLEEVILLRYVIYIIDHSILWSTQNVY